MEKFKGRRVADRSLVQLENRTPEGEKKRKKVRVSFFFARPLEGGIDAWLAYDFPFVTDSLVAKPLSFERRYFSQPLVPTEGFDLVAKELAQRNLKLRDVDTKSVVDLQFVRDLEQSGFLKSLKGISPAPDKTKDRNIKIQRAVAQKRFFARR